MKRVIALLLCMVMLVLVALTGCGQTGNKTEDSSTSKGTTETTKETEATENTETTEATADSDFIADRHITIKGFYSGYTVDPGYKETYAYNKIKELTGISYDLEFNKSDNDLQDITLMLASGDLPDVMVAYCEGTNTSKQASILNVFVKAAKDGMFADMKPHLANTLKWKSFLDTEYLTGDARENIVMRPDFNGQIFLVQLGIPRANVPPAVWFGGTGLFIRKDVADALNVDPSTIQTNEQLYELAKKIKEVDFKDANGKSTPAPIGPSAYGGANSVAYYPEFDFGSSSGFDKDSSEKVKHVMLTDYPYQAVDYVRKMLDEGLMAKETFTLANPQAVEAFSNASYPIMQMHAYTQSWDPGSDVLRTKSPDKMYVPIGPMKNYQGSTEKLGIRRGKSIAAISAQADKPEEIIRFFDWLSTRFMELRLDNGEKGVHFELVDEVSKQYLEFTQPDPWDDGKVPIMTKEWAAKVAENPDLSKTLPAHFMNEFSLVDRYKDRAATFGPADDNDPVKKWYDYGREMQKLAVPQARVVDGIPAIGALEGFSGITKLKPVLDAYDDTMIRAFLANSSNEAVSILDGYKKQLQSAGIEEACKYLEDLESKSPGSILFYVTP